MEKIVVSPTLLKKLDHLIYMLFEKQYFSYLESSEMYIDALVDYIYTIPNLPHRKTKNAKHGA